MSLRQSVADTLVARGFERISRSGSGRLHLRPISDQISLSVDTGPLGRRSDISPRVGLRHDAVEHVLFELLNLNYNPYHVTVDGDVGVILWGRPTVWSDPDVEHALASAGIWQPPTDAVTSIFQALAVFEPYSDLAAIPALWDRVSRVKPSTYVKAVVRFLLGDRDGVQEELQHIEHECGGREHELAQFRTFRQNVLARLAQ